MPDGDSISNKFLHHWRASVELFRGCRPAEEFAARTATALAARLRQSGGIPGLAEATELVRVTREGRISIAEAHQKVGAFERSRGSYNIYLVPVLRRMLAGAEMQAHSKREIAGEVLRESCRAEFSAPMRTAMLEPQFQSRAARDSYMSDCIIRLNETIDSFAIFLARDPSVGTPRLPSVRMASKFNFRPQCL